MEKDVGGGLPDAQPMNHRVGNQTESLNNQVIRGRAAEQNVRQRLQQKNAGTNQYDHLDAGGNEAAPIEVVAARAERRRHKRSVRLRAQRRQSAVSTLMMFVNACGGTGERCGPEILETTGLPRQVNPPPEAGSQQRVNSPRLASAQ